MELNWDDDFCSASQDKNWWQKNPHLSVAERGRYKIKTATTNNCKDKSRRFGNVNLCNREKKSKHWYYRFNSNNCIKLCIVKILLCVYNNESEDWGWPAKHDQYIHGTILSGSSNSSTSNSDNKKVENDKRYYIPITIKMMKNKS